MVRRGTDRRCCPTEITELGAEPALVHGERRRGGIPDQDVGGHRGDGVDFVEDEGIRFLGAGGIADVDVEEMVDAGFQEERATVANGKGRMWNVEAVVQVFTHPLLAGRSERRLAQDQGIFDELGAFGEAREGERAAREGDGGLAHREGIGRQAAEGGIQEARAVDNQVATPVVVLERHKGRRPGACGAQIRARDIGEVTAAVLEGKQGLEAPTQTPSAKGKVVPPTRNAKSVAVPAGMVREMDSVFVPSGPPDEDTNPNGTLFSRLTGLVRTIKEGAAKGRPRQATATGLRRRLELQIRVRRRLQREFDLPKASNTGGEVVKIELGILGTDGRTGNPFHRATGEHADAAMGGLDVGADGAAADGRLALGDKAHPVAIRARAGAADGARRGRT